MSIGIIVLVIVVLGALFCMGLYNRLTTLPQSSQKTRGVKSMCSFSAAMI